MPVNRWSFDDYYYGRGSLYNDRGYEQLNDDKKRLGDESKGFRQSIRFALHDAYSTKQGRMDAQTRKAMRAHYYRQNRKAQGLANG